MERFLATKNSDTYRAQLATSLAEKQEDIHSLISGHELPRINGEYRVLELGTGGGETFNFLQQQLREREDVRYLGVDLVENFASHAKDLGINAVVADAGNLPFEDASLSAINASAIFHEVYTYGVTTAAGEHLTGKDAIEVVIRECARVLAPGGKLAYRDIATPPEGASKAVQYQSKAMQTFIRWWLPKFVSTDSYTLREEEASMVVEGSPVVHKEIQRHYITFRDIVRRVAFPRLGLHIIEESWVDLEQGIKRHEVIVGAPFADGIQGTREETMLSEEYDAFTDTVIAHHWDTVLKLVGTEWFDREGNEHYASLPLHDFSTLVSQASEGQLAVQSGSERHIERYYYTRYLKEWCDSPEFEGKQIAIFKKVG